MRQPVNSRILTAPYLATVTTAGLFFVALGTTLPVLPFVITSDLGAGEGSVGLVFTATAVSALLCRPILGRLGDRRGSERLLLLAVVVAMVGFALHVAAQSVATLVVARLVVGVGQAGLMIAATTLVLDMVPRDRRGEASSYLFVAIQVGLGLGPALGQALYQWGAVTVWIGAGATCVAALPGCLVVLRRPSSRSRPRVTLVRPTYGPALTTGVLAGLGTMGFAGFLAYAPLYSRELGLDKAWIVYLVASGTVILMRILASTAPDRRGPAAVGGFSFLAIAAGFGVIAAAPSVPGLLIGTVVMSAGMSLLVPSLILHATRDVTEGEEARRMSAFTFFLDLAAAVGPTLMALAVSFMGLGHGFALFMLASIAGLLLLRLWVPRSVATPRAESRTNSSDHAHHPVRTHD